MEMNTIDVGSETAICSVELMSQASPAAASRDVPGQILKDGAQNVATGLQMTKND